MSSAREHPDRSAPPDAGGAASDAERLRRLEEHAGFAEYTLDQFSAELAELHKRLGTLVRRIEAMEERLGELSSPDDASPPVERPPHAAGPPPKP